jgi:serine phosphatase RsbU (regulator of sigma subunit)
MRVFEFGRPRNNGDNSTSKRAGFRAPEPSQLPRMRTVNVGGAYRSARVGGDYYEFICAGDRLLFGLFDIAGDRDQALNLAAFIQSALRRFAAEDVAVTGNSNDGLSEFVLDLNRSILNEEGVHNVPAFLAVFDEVAETLSYINAGHTPALLRDQDGIQELAAGGVPLGLFSHVVHEARMMVLRPGSELLVVSRGVVESKSQGKEFGLEGVRAVLATRGFSSAQELCRRVLNAAERMRNAPTFWGPRLVFPNFSEQEKDNDLTAIALMRPAVGSTISARAG